MLFEKKKSETKRKKFIFSWCWFHNDDANLCIHSCDCIPLARRRPYFNQILHEAVASVFCHGADVQPDGSRPHKTRDADSTTNQQKLPCGKASSLHNYQTWTRVLSCRPNTRSQPKSAPTTLVCMQVANFSSAGHWAACYTACKCVFWCWCGPHTSVALTTCHLPVTCRLQPRSVICLFVSSV